LCPGADVEFLPEEIMNRARALVVLTCGLLVGSVHLVKADVRADQRNLVKFEGMLGRVVNILGGKAAKEGVKTTEAVKGDRKMSLGDTTGQIIDLKEEKVYDLDVKKKSYKVTTFEELRRRMAEAQRKAEEDARKEQPKEAKAPQQPDKNAKEMEVDVSVKDTGQKKNINGFDTHEVVTTVTVREKGSTLEQSGGMVLTADMWLGPTITSMKELAEFDARYARQLAGPMIAGASPEEMASAMAMYPGLKDAMARMQTENVKMSGTPILTTVTVDAVKSAAQLAEEQKQDQPSSGSGNAAPSVGGLLGGLARRAVPKKEAPSQRATFMTTTNEVLKVTTDVSAADVAIPAGFKESK
jgi:hypothetical protein